MKVNVLVLVDDGLAFPLLSQRRPHVSNASTNIDSSIRKETRLDNRDERQEKKLFEMKLE